MTVEQLEPYRTIGPFDRASLPAGLLARHALKPAVWASLEVISGAIRFVWDMRPDAASEVLAAPAKILVPPEEIHHLEIEGEFALTITFMREPAAT